MFVLLQLSLAAATLPGSEDSSFGGHADSLDHQIRALEDATADTDVKPRRIQNRASTNPESPLYHFEMPSPDMDRASSPEAQEPIFEEKSESEARHPDEERVWEEERAAGFHAAKKLAAELGLEEWYRNELPKLYDLHGAVLSLLPSDSYGQQQLGSQWYGRLGGRRVGEPPTNPADVAYEQHLIRRGFSDCGGMALTPARGARPFSTCPEWAQQLAEDFGLTEWFDKLVRANAELRQDHAGRRPPRLLSYAELRIVRAKQRRAKRMAHMRDWSDRLLAEPDAQESAGLDVDNILDEVDAQQSAGLDVDNILDEVDDAKLNKFLDEVNLDEVLSPDEDTSEQSEQSYAFGDLTKGILAKGDDLTQGILAKGRAARGAEEGYKFGDFTRGLFGEHKSSLVQGRVFREHVTRGRST